MPIKKIELTRESKIAYIMGFISAEDSVKKIEATPKEISDRINHYLNMYDEPEVKESDNETFNALMDLNFKMFELSMDKMYDKGAKDALEKLDKEVTKDIKDNLEWGKNV